MLKNLPVRLKLCALYVWMSFMTIMVYVLSIIAMQNIVSSKNDNADTIINGIQQAYSIQLAIEEQTTDAWHALRQVSVGQSAAVSLQSVSATASAASAGFSGLEGIVATDETARRLYQSAYQTYSDSFAPLISQFSSNMASGNTFAAEQTLSSAEATAETLRSSLDQIVSHFDGQMDIAAQTGQKTINYAIIGYVVFSVIYAFLTVLVGRKLASTIAAPLYILEKAATQISVGDVDVDLNYDSEDEVGRLVKRFREMLSGMQEQARVLSVVASGDLTATIAPRSDKDIVNKAIGDMISANSSIISSIADSSQIVLTGAEQISFGSQNLAAGSAQQASSVEEFSATLSEVRDQIDATAKNAQLALEVTTQAGHFMAQGLSSMDNLSTAMETISQSSQSITKVNKVIDDIAFQTNILALNAAVEAARAGIHGKGFAVVADEVRNLAAKSAAAAKETTDLIENSNQKVREGSDLVKQTNQDITAVAELAQKNLVYVQDIAQESQQQAESLKELSGGIQQISEVVQSNSATAEQAAASAQEMSSQANMLNSLVAGYKLTASGTTHLTRVDTLAYQDQTSSFAMGQ